MDLHDLVMEKSWKSHGILLCSRCRNPVNMISCLIKNVVLSVTAQRRAGKKGPAKRESAAKVEARAKAEAKKDALKAKRAVVKGPRATRKRKIRTKVVFRRPKTLKLARSPRYPRKSVPRTPR